VINKKYVYIGLSITLTSEIRMLYVKLFMFYARFFMNFKCQQLKNPRALRFFLCHLNQDDHI
jgi:hypothetical protein